MNRTACCPCQGKYSWVAERFEKDAFINIDNPAKVSEYLAKFEKERTGIRDRIADLRKLTTLPGDQSRLSQIEADLNVYLDGITTVFKKVQAGKITTAEAGNQAVG